MPINSVPVYGVEPYNALGVPAADDYGGGADVTQENLLITLWTNPGDEDLDIPGELIKPFGFTAFAQDPDTVGAYQPALSKQAFRSRAASRFFYTGGSQEGNTNMLAILNPPAELKESFLLNDPPDLNPPSLTVGLNTGLSLFSHMVWEYYVRDDEGELVEGEIAFSGLPLFGEAVIFAKTNGADGVWPEFYTITSPLDVSAFFNALRNGAPFYIAAAIQAPNASGYVDIRWPFSGAARG